MVDALDPFYMGLLVRTLTVFLAISLSLISFEAWRRTKRSLMLFVALAFMAYLIRDLIHLSEIASPESIPPLVLSLADILDLTTLVILFFAVVKKE